MMDLEQEEPEATPCSTSTDSPTRQTTFNGYNHPINLDII